MKQKILVVEDEEHLAVALRFNFEEEGFEVGVAGDGPTAVELWRQARELQAPFDIVVLDLMLPHMSGYEVCQAIRADDRDLPILILSARSLAEDRILAFDAGSNQYLTKPFNLPELLSRVRNLLEYRPVRRDDAAAATPNGGNGDVVRFGSAVVNFRSFVITVGGVEKTLSPLHMQVLKLFVENEGAVLSRRFILEKVWGRSIIPSTNRVVDNAVLTLRKTFEVDPGHPRHFQSVRGAGYRFVQDPE